MLSSFLAHLDPLSGERRIAVDQERQDCRALGCIAVLFLLGSDFPQHHWVDDLKMRRIGDQGQVNPLTADLPIRRGSQMIFYVAGPFNFVREE